MYCLAKVFECMVNILWWVSLKQGVNLYIVRKKNESPTQKYGHTAEKPKLLASSCLLEAGFSFALQPEHKQQHSGPAGDAREMTCLLWN